MAVTGFDALHENTVQELAGKRFDPDEKIIFLSQAFEVDWNKAPSHEQSETDSWPMGQTLWFSVLMSGALWTIIVGLAWLI